jgi:hypothetical protein
MSLSTGNRAAMVFLIVEEMQQFAIKVHASYTMLPQLMHDGGNHRKKP